MGAGVSLPAAQHLLNEECPPAHLQDQLSTATVYGCRSLDELNSWYRIHCNSNDKKYLAKILMKDEHHTYIKPIIAQVRYINPEAPVSLSEYLDELVALQVIDRPTIINDDGVGVSGITSNTTSNTNRNSPAVSQLPPVSSLPATKTAPSITPTLSLPSSRSVENTNNSSGTNTNTNTSIGNKQSEQTMSLAHQHDGEAEEMESVDFISGPESDHQFIHSLLDLLYTSRQRRTSSTMAIDLYALSAAINSIASDAPVPLTHSPKPASRLSLSFTRRHLRSIHSNLPPIEEVLETESSIILLLKYFPRSLAAYLRNYSSSIDSNSNNTTGINNNIFDSSQHKLFLIYQLLHCLSFLHERHIIHGDINTNHCMLTGNMWIYLTGFICPSSIPPFIQTYDTGESYLMRWAGREIGGGDVADHPILPWVSDFTSSSPSSYRDLSKSKFRLKKGDDQLDFTYLQSTNNPHHITELFSDITYYVYLARISPITTLKRIVRDRFVAAEYPPSMARIYLWTPDEAIPEFYTDTNIFESQHKELGLDDLKLPAWTPDPQSFIKWHRNVLDSPEISARLPDWIDITFGYKLSGQAAIDAKNVPLKTTKQSSRRSAFIQLFHKPHPHKIIKDKPTQLHSTAQDIPTETREEPKTHTDSEQAEEGATSITITDSNGLEVSTMPREAPRILNRDASSTSSTSSTDGSVSTLLSSSSMLSPAVQSAVSELAILQEAATFETEYIALEGCYKPIFAPIDISKDEEEREDNEEDDIDSISKDGDGDAESVKETSTTASTKLSVLDPSSGTSSDSLLSLASISSSESPVSESQRTLLLLQSGDIFSVGCIAAELFLGHPLFSPVTHRLYALGQYHPALENVPVGVKKMILSMIQLDALTRPTATELLKNSVFRIAQDDTAITYRPHSSLVKSNIYQGVYDFISELRRQQSLFHHPSPSTITTAPSTAVSGSHTPTIPTTTESARSPSPYLLSMSSSFSIPSDDISTPPIRPSPLNDMSITTPPEFSPIGFALGENNKEDGDAFQQMNRKDSHHHLEEGLDTEEDVQDDDENGEKGQLNESSSAHNNVANDSNDTITGLPRSQSDSGNQPQITLDWTLDQLTSLMSLPLPAFVLLIPHALSLSTHPDLYISSVRLFIALARKLGRALSSQLLLPSLQQLWLHVEHIDLQCELLSISTLRMIYVYFSYPDGFREYLAHVRNSLLSPEPRVTEAAVNTIYTFVVEHLDLYNSIEAEIAVRELLLPMFSRLGRPGSEVILAQLIRIAAEVNERIISHFFLPNTIQLIEKGAAAATTNSNSELELRLSCGLDLLYALLPDLSFNTLQYLLNETQLLRSLLNGSARGPLSAPAMRKLLKVLLYIVVEFGLNGDDGATGNTKSSDNRQPSQKETSDGSSGSLRFQNPRLILPLLPLFADFLNQMMGRMEQIRQNAAISSGQQKNDPYDARSCYEFIHFMYLGLCATVGPTIIRKAVSSTVKIENLLSQPPPAADSSGINSNTPRKSTSSKLSYFSPKVPHNSSSSSRRSHYHHHTTSLDLNRSADVEKVKKNAIIGKAKRAHWGEREQERERQRQERRKMEALESELIAQEQGIADDLFHNLARYYDDEILDGSDDEHDGEDTETGTATHPVEEEDRFVKIGGGKDHQRSKSKTLAVNKETRAVHQSLSNPTNVAGAGSGTGSLTPSSSLTSLDQKRSLFSWLSTSSAANDASGLSMDMSELWTIDPPLSASASAALAATTGGSAWKYKATVRHTLKAHTASILSIDSHPYHGMFVTGGKDEYVKVWSVGLATGGLNCLGVFKGHRAPVTDVKLLVDESCSVARCVASCDGGLQVWDLETSQVLLQSPFGTAHNTQGPKKGTGPHSVTKESAVHISAHLVGNASIPMKGEQPQPITVFNYDANQHQLVLGTSIGTLRHLDVRSGYLSGAWIHLGAAQPMSAVKCIAINCNTNSLVTGLATGELTLFDQRTGMIRFQWRAHEGPVLTVLTTSAETILSSGADRCICLWDISGHEPILIQKFIGLEDQIKNIVQHQSDFIAGLLIGKIGAATLSIDKDKPRQQHGHKMSMTTLKGYTGRSQISCMSMLPTYKSTHTNRDIKTERHTL